ncbi:type IV pilin protein [Chromobacterium sp. IIBBL 290-4]|uniref:type IV pilin protein n=1 Tax=Chromobacterium sp. IIBBL 290-4 TaxID=2953890 RepID=UPI0020B753DC|nr:type IV pilin protein [Chromobacterium sp. IIBBL 290-4]UTH74334.1 type IV pilin protein [Chromobacterium sp. IIBBL 290-4]
MKRISEGFSLMELVIAVAVLAILIGIALPSYQSFILQSNRASAKTALQDLATRQENYYALQNTYASQLATLGYASGTIYVPGNGNNLYALAISSSTASAYTLTATPQGNQAQDSCQTYQLDNLGNQSNINASGTALSVSGCW